MKFLVTYIVKVDYDETDDYSKKYETIIEVEAGNEVEAREKSWQEMQKRTGPNDYIILTELRLKDELGLGGKGNG